MKSHTLIPLIFASVLLFSFSCKNRKVDGKENIGMKLYETYKEGEIERCMHNGAVVYKCAHNAYDAGNEIYDAKGVKIGSCYYSSRQVDPICKDLTDCQTIWRREGNM